ncbi:Rieske 2Fe-2S domain-containing protein [Brevibacillus sp. NRS-1366]|uniref:Rieske 2Fe-2S domain-containing protein n=1 Tax=Brevibacillus sp. NRS-1366 TaxID=3233899 RepID=UPI003D19C971
MEVQAKWEVLARWDELSEDQGKAVKHGDTPLVIFKQKDQATVMVNRCPHKGAPLHGGKIVNGEVVCPWHNFRFDTCTGVSPTNPGRCATMFPTKIENGFILADLANPFMNDQNAPEDQLNTSIGLEFNDYIKRKMKSAGKFNLELDLFDTQLLKKYQGFVELGDQVSMIVRPQTSIPLMEIINGEIKRRQFKSFSVNITYAGTPHHSPGYFGFWHINDVDEMYISVPGQEEGEDPYLIIVMNKPREEEKDTWAHFCLKCGTLLFERSHEIAKTGVPGIWASERKYLKEFNSDITLRTCKNCGEVHPLGYSIMKKWNTPEEEAARTTW